MIEIVPKNDTSLLIIRTHFGAGALYFTERPNNSSSLLARIREGSICVIIPGEVEYGAGGIVCYYHVLLADICKSGWIRANDIYYA